MEKRDNVKSLLANTIYILWKLYKLITLRIGVNGFLVIFSVKCVVKTSI